MRLFCTHHPRAVRMHIVNFTIKPTYASAYRVNDLERPNSAGSTCERRACFQRVVHDPDLRGVHGAHGSGELLHTPIRYDTEQKKLYMVERLKDGNIHMCFFLPFRLQAVYKPTPVPMKSTFRYNSMFNFIPVLFCFLLILGLGLGSVIGLGIGFGNLKIFDRWRCRHSGRFHPLDACVLFLP